MDTVDMSQDMLFRKKYRSQDIYSLCKLPRLNVILKVATEGSKIRPEKYFFTKIFR